MMDSDFEEEIIFVNLQLQTSFRSLVLDLDKQVIFLVLFCVLILESLTCFMF